MEYKNYRGANEKIIFYSEMSCAHGCGYTRSFNYGDCSNVSRSRMTLLILTIIVAIVMIGALLMCMKNNNLPGSGV